MKIEIGKTYLRGIGSYCTIVGLAKSPKINGQTIYWSRQGDWYGEDGRFLQGFSGDRQSELVEGLKAIKEEVGKTSTLENMTPYQRSCSKEVQREAYQRLPMTCDKVREILDEVQLALMEDLNIDRADEAIIDAIMSQTFIQIRDEVTQKFRDEQMELLNCCR